MWLMFLITQGWDILFCTSYSQVIPNNRQRRSRIDHHKHIIIIYFDNKQTEDAIFSVIDIFILSQVETTFLVVLFYDSKSTLCPGNNN